LNFAFYCKTLENTTLVLDWLINLYFSTSEIEFSNIILQCVLRFPLFGTTRVDPTEHDFPNENA